MGNASRMKWISGRSLCKSIVAWAVLLGAVVGAVPAAAEPSPKQGGDSLPRLLERFSDGDELERLEAAAEIFRRARESVKHFDDTEVPWTRIVDGYADAMLDSDRQVQSRAEHLLHSLLPGGR